MLINLFSISKIEPSDFFHFKFFFIYVYVSADVLTCEVLLKIFNHADCHPLDCYMGQFCLLQNCCPLSWNVNDFFGFVKRLYVSKPSITDRICVTFQQKFQVSSKKLSPPYDVVQIKKQVTLFELSRGIVTPDNQVVMFAKLTFKLDKKKIEERNYLVRSRTTNSFIILETINRSIVGAEYTQEMCS